MQNISKKNKLCEKKKIFTPKIAMENAIKKRSLHLQKTNFKVQETTKVFNKNIADCSQIRFKCKFSNTNTSDLFKKKL